MTTQSPEETDVVVVGGGQAGLAASYYLTQKQFPHVVLERGRIGESWRAQRWDAFSINTTNKVNTLPGSLYTGPEPEAFKTAHGWAAYLVEYASTHSLPVRTGVTVASVRMTDGGRFLVTTDKGLLLARSVVAATGSFITPKVPAIARSLPEKVTQFNAGTYRNATQVPAGAVLVVGSGDSGCQIAEDLLDSGREVYLCLSNRRRVPRRYRGLDLCDWSIISGRWEMTIDTVEDRSIIWNPDAPLASGVGGGHTLAYQALEAKGARLLGKLLDVRDGKLIFDGHVNDYVKFGDDSSAGFKKGMDALIERTGMEAPAAEPDPLDIPDSRASQRDVIRELDLDESGISSAIWTIGFTHDFSWLDAPVFDEQGHPEHERGVTQVPGLYFTGLHWLYTLSSGLIYGVGRDAEHLVNVIEKQLT